MSLVSEDFRGLVAQRLRAEHAAVAARWLERLAALLPLDPNRVFPTDHLLDHIPELIVAIADYLKDPQREEIVANTHVVGKARELGELRYVQQASVHQIVREYRLFEGVLSTFLKEVIENLPLEPASADVVDLLGRVHQAVSVLQQSTLGEFIDRYSQTVAQQQTRLEAFNRMVSHELRQPVGAMQFAIRLLQDSPAATSDQERRRLLELLERNVHRTHVLTQHLTRLSGLYAPSAHLQVQRVSLATLAREVARQLRDMAAARHVALEVSDNLPEAVVDIGAVELMLVNLVSNGIKYSDPAKPERYVRVEGAAGEAECILSVTDNGLGIPASQQETIFAQRVRAHAARDAELGNHGLGMGLTIVRDCLRAVGGRIDVQSAEGEGTVFTVRLPHVRLPAG